MLRFHFARRLMFMLLAAAMAVAPMRLPSAAVASPKPIVLLSYGGPWDDLTRQYVADPFTKATGIPVIIRPFSGDQTNSLLAQKDDPQYDLVLLGPDDYLYLREHGVLEHVSYADIPNSKYLYPMARVPNGVATSITGVTIVYNTEKIKKPPTSWRDLWNPEYKGHVAIQSMPNSYGLDTLVMAAKLNGGDEHHIDAGFEALQRLKPNLAGIYGTSSQAAQMFEQGGVWIAPWYSGRVASTRAAGVPVAAATPKEGEVAYLTILAPLKGKYSKEVAEFMNAYLSTDTQKAFAEKFSAGPSRDDVKLDPETAKNVPYGKKEVNALLQFDWSYIISKRQEWTQRFLKDVAS